VELTHVDRAGAARMVDVSGKEISVRRAVAAGVVRTTEEVIGLLSRDALPSALLQEVRSRARLRTSTCNWKMPEL